MLFLFVFQELWRKHEIYDAQEYDPWGLQRVLQQVNMHSIAPNPTKVPISFVASSKERSCEGCGITWNRPMPRCIKCKLVRYCSRDCQVAHWMDHKKSCHKSSTATVATSGTTASSIDDNDDAENVKDDDELLEAID